MLLKSEIIWTRIGQVIWSQNDVNISETLCPSQVTLIFFSSNTLYIKIFLFYLMIKYSKIYFWHFKIDGI